MTGDTWTHDNNWRVSNNCPWAEYNESGVRVARGKQMNTRFNFSLSTIQDEWVRRRAFEQRVSKADIVRGLIDRAMKEDHTMARYEVIEDNAGGLVRDNLHRRRKFS